MKPSTNTSGNTSVNTAMALTDFRTEATVSVKKIVESYIQYFKKANRETTDLTPLLSEKFKFSGPLGVFTSRDAFLADIKKNALAITDIKIHHVLVEGQHASALYDVYSSDSTVKKLLLSEWFTIENNQIAAVFSVYDAADVKDLFSQI